ncbi:MAG: response regulator transcription factor [Chloroflexi bacterium]|nr:response regulator transcription factor [Chloroflexota bacterium]
MAKKRVRSKRIGEPRVAYRAPGQELASKAGSRFGLTVRELEVIRLIAEGRRNQEIAEVLTLSPRTVKRHLESIFGKMGVNDRTEAITRAVEEGLSPPQPSSDETPFALEDWRWIQEHRPELASQYAGHWIAVAQKQVVGQGSRLATALRRAKAKGFDHPLVMAFRPARLRNAVEVAHWL